MKFKIVFCLLCILALSCEDELKNDQEPNFTLIVNVQEGGEVSTTGGSYKAGTIITIKATPDAEYIFTGWSNGSKENPLTLTINTDIDITAKFEKVTITKLSIILKDEEIMMGNSTSVSYEAYNQLDEIVENIIPELILSDSLLATIVDTIIQTEYDGILKIYGTVQGKTDSVELNILPDYNNWKTYFYPAKDAMPNISYFFESVGGGGATYFAKADLNLDGYEDILFHVFHGMEYQESGLPTPNNLLALLNNGDNTFRDGNFELFGTEEIDLFGGATGGLDQKDLNCDGYTDFVFALHHEDGRAKGDEVADWKNNNAAIISNGDGTYSIIEIEAENSGYNGFVKIISEGFCTYSVIFTGGLDYSFSGGFFLPLNNQYIDDDLYQNRGLGAVLSYDSDNDGVDDMIIHEAGYPIQYLVAYQRNQGTWTRTSEFHWDNAFEIYEERGPFGCEPSYAVINDGKVYIWGYGGWNSGNGIRLYPNSNPLPLMRYAASTVNFIPQEGDTIFQERYPWSKLMLFDINGNEMNLLDVIQEPEGPYNINFMEVMDLNGDSYDDIAQYPYRVGGRPIVHINNKSGAFDILDERKLPTLNDENYDTFWWGNPHSFFIDVNNDNLLDLLYRAEGCGEGGYPSCGDLHLFLARKKLD